MGAERLEARAWELLQAARLEIGGRVVGVRAACDDVQPLLNYGHCFVRDFAVCAPAFLMRGGEEVVRAFLETTLALQSRRRGLEALEPRRGLMPASFRPRVNEHGEQTTDPDYGEESIARVTPVDSVFWWMLTLRAYTRITGDRSLAHREDFQQGIGRILRLTLEGSFEMFPTLLVPEGAFMIDRRLGTYGHPLEVQALFFAALRVAKELLLPAAEDEVRVAMEHRLRNLRHDVGRRYWLTQERLEHLRHTERDQFGEEIVNAFNVFPEAIPDWIRDWLPEDAGYLAGNVGPGRIDFRFFAQGNLLAASVGLCNRDQALALLRLYEARWDDLMGAAPLRIVYPALDGEAWRLITGADSKNEAWRNHNGGWWPCLLWSFAPAAVSLGRPDLLERALEATERRVDRDGWPEYYDGRSEPVVGDHSRLRQSWTFGAYLYARDCLADPAAAELYVWPDEIRPQEAHRAEGEGEVEVDPEGGS